MTTAETLIPWRHCCGGVAFYTTRRVEFGDVLEARIFRQLDGSAPADGDLMVCGACGNPIDLLDGFTRGVVQEPETA